MYLLEVENNILTLSPKENHKYVLSDWNLKTNSPTGYFSRVAHEIIRRKKTAQIMVVGLGGGSIIGELMKYIKTKSSIVSIEIDKNIILQGYNQFSTHFPPNAFVKHQIVNQDILLFQNDVLKHKCTAIVCDIPLVYEISSFDLKQTFIKKILDFCSNQCICIFNTVSHENALSWIEFLQKKWTQKLSSRPRILNCQNHFILYVIIS